MAIPLDYGNAAAEYDAVRRAVGVVDHSGNGVLEVTGRDRAAFLHAMLSNDVKSLAAGQGCAASLLDVHGKIQTFLWVLALEDRVLLLTPPGRAQSTIDALDAYLFSEKAYFLDATGEFAIPMLAGPEAPALVHRLTGASLPDAPWGHLSASLASVSIRVVRGGGETGEPEALLLVPAPDGETVWQKVIEAGARPFGLAALESLRIESGTPAFGDDADSSVLLPEIPFLDKVSYTKGCYVGQEVVVRIRDRGHVNRMLRGLVLDGESVPTRGATIVADGNEAGRVTSAAWSFGLKRPIALGFVKRQQAEPGTMVDVVLPDGERAHASVSALPFAR
ncbi:MAG: hypothetical protein DMD81_00975 [Candidatus Rokuibacteriota bacterium]|nr:MAG: hypothetical protein DMD81_00975 [Candidatus Rokubacteria bacterium]